MTQSNRAKFGSYRVSKQTGKRFQSPFPERKNIRSHATSQLTIKSHKYLNLPNHSAIPTSYNATEALSSVHSLITKGKKLLSSISASEKSFKRGMEYELAKGRLKLDRVEELLNKVSEYDHHQTAPLDSSIDGGTKMCSVSDDQTGTHLPSSSVRNDDDDDDMDDEKIIILSESEEDHQSSLDGSAILEESGAESDIDEYKESNRFSDKDLFGEEQYAMRDDGSNELCTDTNVEDQSEVELSSNEAFESNDNELVSTDEIIEDGSLPERNTHTLIEISQNEDPLQSFGAGSVSELSSASAISEKLLGDECDSKMDNVTEADYAAVDEYIDGASSPPSDVSNFVKHTLEEPVPSESDLSESRSPSSRGSKTDEVGIEEDGAHIDEYTSTNGASLKEYSTDLNALQCLAVQALDQEEAKSHTSTVEESDVLVINTDSSTDDEQSSCLEDNDDNIHGNGLRSDGVGALGDYEYEHEEAPDEVKNYYGLIHTDAEYSMSLKASRECPLLHEKSNTRSNSNSIVTNSERNNISFEGPNILQNSQEPSMIISGDPSHVSPSDDSIENTFPSASLVSNSNIRLEEETSKKYAVTFIQIENATGEETIRSEIKNSDSTAGYKSIFREDPFEMDDTSKETESLFSLLEEMGIRGISDPSNEKDRSTVLMDAKTLSETKNVEAINVSAFPGDLSIIASSGSNETNNQDTETILNPQSFISLNDEGNNNKKASSNYESLNQNYSLNHFTSDAIHSQLPHTSQTGTIHSEVGHVLSVPESLGKDSQENFLDNSNEMRDSSTGLNSTIFPTRKQRYDSGQDSNSLSPTLPIYKMVEPIGEGPFLKTIPLLNPTVSDVTESADLDSSPRIPLTNISRRFDSVLKANSEVKNSTEAAVNIMREEGNLHDGSLDSSATLKENESEHISRTLEKSLQNIEDNIEEFGQNSHSIKDIGTRRRNDISKEHDDYHLPIKIPLTKSPLKRSNTRSPFKDSTDHRTKELADYVKSVLGDGKNPDLGEDMHLFSALHPIKSVEINSNQNNQDGNFFVEEISLSQHSTEMEVQLIGKKPEIIIPSSPENAAGFTEPNFVNLESNVVEEIMEEGDSGSSVNDANNSDNISDQLSSSSGREISYVSAQSSPFDQHGSFVPDHSNGLQMDVNEASEGNLNVALPNLIRSTDGVDHSEINKNSENSMPHEESRVSHFLHLDTVQKNSEIFNGQYSKSSTYSSSTLPNQTFEMDQEYEGSAKNEELNHEVVDNASTIFNPFNELIQSFKIYKEKASLQTSSNSVNTDLSSSNRIVAGPVKAALKLAGKMQEIKIFTSQFLKSFSSKDAHPLYHETRELDNAHIEQDSASQSEAQDFRETKPRDSNAQFENEMTPSTNIDNILDADLETQFPDRLENARNEEDTNCSIVVKTLDSSYQKNSTNSLLQKEKSSKASQSVTSKLKRSYSAVSSVEIRSAPRKRSKKGRKRRIIRNTGPKRDPRKR